MKRFCSVSRIPVLLFAIVVAAAGCERTKSATPLSPSLAGPMEGITITPPAPMQPSAGQKIKDTEQPVTIQFSNADSNSVRPFKLLLQISTDASFNTIVYSQTGIAPSENGVNRLVLPAKLQSGRVYYWRTKADDGANASDWSEPVAFEILQPIVIGVAEPLSPISNVRVATNTPELRVRNGVSTGPHGQLHYQFQASLSPAFTGLVANQSVPQGGGETSLLVPGSPGPDMVVYWRVRISDEEGNLGEWSRTESYRTPLPAVGGGGGGGGGSPAPGGPCIFSTPEAVVACERNKYGHMSDAQMAAFMRAVATSLNASGIPGGPFGILRKTSGHNCGGYSCDIICAGNGGNQQQWDVLGDIDGAQTPGWGGPLPSIRMDVCEVP